METLPAGTLATLAGLGIGAVVGATALLTNFCALGGIADILFAKDWRRMRSWTLAAGVAIVGTQTLDSLRLIHIDRILPPYVVWLPTLLGGVCFGFGMSLAGGCVNRALVRTGAGSLKSLVTVIVVGIAAAITLSDTLAPFIQALERQGRLEVLSTGALHRIFGIVPSWDSEIVRWVFAGLIGGGLVIFSLKDSWFRSSRDHMLAGLIIGAMIPMAWLLSEITGPQAAIDFAEPVGNLLIALIGMAPFATFSAATVIGVPVGAFVAGALTRNLAMEKFTGRGDFTRHFVGAALMGFGGTIALGCTFGQGLSGFSTLSVSAFFAIAGIITGCLWGIRYFEAGSVWGGLKLALKRGA